MIRDEVEDVTVPEFYRQMLAAHLWTPGDDVLQRYCGTQVRQPVPENGSDFAAELGRGEFSILTGVSKGLRAEGELH